MQRIYIEAVQLGPTDYRVYLIRGKGRIGRAVAIEVYFNSILPNAELKAELLAVHHLLTKTNYVSGRAYGGEGYELYFSDSRNVGKLQLEQSELRDCIPYAHWLQTRFIGAAVLQREESIVNDFSGEIIATIAGHAEYETFRSPVGDIVMGKHAAIRVAGRLALGGGIPAAIRKLNEILTGKNLLKIELTDSAKAEFKIKYGSDCFFLAHPTGLNQLLAIIISKNDGQHMKIVTSYKIANNDPVISSAVKIGWQR